MLVHRRVTPNSKLAGTHLYTWVERGTTRVKYLAQEHNAVPRPGLEPRPPDPESSALTIRPPRLSLIVQAVADALNVSMFQIVETNPGFSPITTVNPVRERNSLSTVTIGHMPPFQCLINQQLIFNLQ